MLRIQGSELLVCLKIRCMIFRRVKDSYNNSDKGVAFCFKYIHFMELFLSVEYLISGILLIALPGVINTCFSSMKKKIVVNQFLSSWCRSFLLRSLLNKPEEIRLGEMLVKSLLWPFSPTCNLWTALPWTPQRLPIAHIMQFLI